MVAASSAVRGSSNNRRRGRVTSVRARATRWRSPPESSAGRRCARPPIRNISRICRERASRSPLRKPASPYSAFPLTDRWGNKASDCSKYPTARRFGGKLICAAESNRAVEPTAMRPSSGVRNPAMQSRRVVFPAPDDPKRIVKPGPTANSTSRVKGWSGLAIFVRIRTRRSALSSAAHFQPHTFQAVRPRKP